MSSLVEQENFNFVICHRDILTLAERINVHSIWHLRACRRAVSESDRAKQQGIR
jgi:hypothetical protein